jgi:hypothetical protein
MVKQQEMGDMETNGMSRVAVEAKKKCKSPSIARVFQPCFTPPRALILQP